MSLSPTSSSPPLAQIPEVAEVLSLSSLRGPHDDEGDPGDDRARGGEEEAVCLPGYRGFYPQGLCYLRVDAVTPALGAPGG